MTSPTVWAGPVRRSGVASIMADEEGATKRQVYIRCNGKALKTTLPEVLQFFEAVGKPTSVLNKWGEEVEEGADLRELVLVSFKKTKVWHCSTSPWALSDARS